MSARLNLAPEVYQNNQRNKRRRHTATMAATVVGLACAGLVILGLLILGGQAVYIGTLQKNIDDNEKQLQTYPDLQAAATIAQHLDSLQSLSNQKIYLSRFFSVLQEYAPQGIAASNLVLDENNKLEFTGTSKSYSLASKFAKALQEKQTSGSALNSSKFTNVDLQALTDNSSGGINFKITTQVSNEVTSGK